jgi:hypothetical protein
MKTFLALLTFATLARVDDAQTAIKAIETENRVKFVGEAPINGSNRTQWIFAAPDNSNGIRIRIPNFASFQIGIPRRRAECIWRSSGRL